jgi:hypothetical protein
VLLPIIIIIEKEEEREGVPVLDWSRPMEGTLVLVKGLIIIDILKNGSPEITGVFFTGVFTTGVFFASDFTANRNHWRILIL